MIIQKQYAFVNNIFYKEGKAMRLDKIKLHTKMLEKDINTIKLSENTGLSRATISSVRCGKSCTYETAEKLAKALKCNVSDLQ